MKRKLILSAILFFHAFSSVFADEIAPLIKKTFLTPEVSSLNFNITGGKLTIKPDFIDNIIVDVKGDLDASIPKIEVKKGTLYVKTSVFASQKKNHFITVFVPYNIEFENIKLISTSASFTVEDQSFKTLDCTTASGNLEFKNCKAESYIKPATGSGKVTIDSCKIKNAIVSTVYGKITFKDTSFSILQTETINGAINLNNVSANQFQLQSTAAIINADFAVPPQNDSFIRSSSGVIQLHLPPNTGYTAHVKTDSGQFSDENTGFHSVIGEITSVYLDGKANISLTGGSGNIKILDESSSPDFL